AAWSREIVRSVLDELEGEYAARGERDLFGRLVGCITGDDEATYAEIAAAHEKPAAAVKMAAHRLRRRFGERLRDRVAVYTADEAGKEELRRLLAALRETAGAPRRAGGHAGPRPLHPPPGRDLWEPAGNERRDREPMSPLRRPRARLELGPLP